MGLALLLPCIAGCHVARTTHKHQVIATECFDTHGQAEARLALASQQLNALTDGLRTQLVDIMGTDAADTGELMVTCCM